MKETDSMGSNIPSGWSYNPSSFSQRWVLVVAGAIGFAIATYLTLFQIGIIKRPYDPFFGSDSSIIILTSPFARFLPIPDAALGAIAYLAEVVLDLIGDEDRWRGKPWLVVVFGLVVASLGVVSTALLIFQPVLFNAWCTLCIVSAVISIGVMGSAMDELLAALQQIKCRSAKNLHINRQHANSNNTSYQQAKVQRTKKNQQEQSKQWRHGRPTVISHQQIHCDQGNHHQGNNQRHDRQQTSKPLYYGVLPNLLNAFLGISLIVAPSLLVYGDGLEIFHRIAGPIAFAAGVTAAYEPVRAVRWVNIILGLLLLLSLLFVGLSLPGSLFGALTGMLMVILGLNSKATRNSFDGGWRILIFYKTP